MAIGRTNAVTITGGSSYGDAVAADLLDGKTMVSGGTQITGTMPNRGEVDTDITTKAQVVTIAAGYHNGSGTVQISSTEQAKIIATNIKRGITMLGVGGTVKPFTSLSANNSLSAPPTASYNHTTELNGWTGKTILIEWQTSYDGDGGSAKLLEQSLSLNSSGVLIFFVVSSTSVRLTSSTSNTTINSTSTQVTNINGSTNLQWSIFEVI